MGVNPGGIEFVGVSPFYPDPQLSYLKPFFLLFDRITVHQTCAFWVQQLYAEQWRNPVYRATAEFVAAHRLVFDTPVQQFLYARDDTSELSRARQAYVQSTQQAVASESAAILSGLGGRQEQLLHHCSDLAKAINQTDLNLSRFCAEHLRTTGEWYVSPVFSQPRTGHAFETGPDQVCHIVLRSLPIPGPLTSWQDILDFRSDPCSRRLMIALRHWILATAKGQRTHLEVAQELEWLVSEYDHYMRVHRMDASIGTIETIVTVATEVIENMAHFKPSTAVKGLFALRHRKALLLKDELNAPGREVAYIIRARQTFGPKGGE